MRSWTRQLATLLFCVYALVGTSLVPAVVAFVAACDGSHEVKVQLTASGSHLVLHHEEGNYTPAVTDHTSASGRFLVRLCHNDSEGNHELDSQCLTSWVPDERDPKGDPATELAGPLLNLAASFVYLLTQPRLVIDSGSDVRWSHSCTSPPGAKPRPMMATVQLLV